MSALGELNLLSDKASSKQYSKWGEADWQPFHRSALVGNKMQEIADWQGLLERGL